MNAPTLLLLAIVLAATVAAQTPTKVPQSQEVPTYDQENPGRGNCLVLAAKHWMAVTDPTLSSEEREFHEHAALAYERLAPMGWPC